MDDAAQSKRSKRPNFSVEFKRQIVEATLKPGASAALIAREHDVNANLLFKWGRHYLAGDFGMPDVPLPEAPRSAGYPWRWRSLCRKQRPANRRTVSAPTRSNAVTSGYD
ncbi:transposase [Caballeronia sp. LP003]|uniref:transposase n=1 Tax=Caballeronia sp. LP003 TaxID=3038551 RepID=UPI00285798CB|nr:transposase [Caballeronia sp. LP003]MDR5785505.1 transposase [Caballeronia sp. LP003]